MPFVSLPGLLPDYSDGRSTGDFVSKVANAAADFACGLYRDFPAAVVSDTSPNSFGRGLMDSLCNGRGALPPAPTPVPGEGQCKCTDYLISVTITPPDGDASTFELAFRGRVLGVVRLPEVDNNGLEPVVLRYLPCDSSGNELQPAELTLGIAGLGTEVSPGGIRRADGGVDNCGTANHKWDDSFPRTIPPDRIVQDTTINYNDGTDITVPVVYAPISAVANINPNIKIDVGGINVTFDLSGAKIDFGGGDENTGQPRNRDNDSSDDFSRIDKQLREIRDRLRGVEDDLDDVKSDKNDSPPPQDDPSVEAEEDEEESDSGDKDVDKLQYVCVHLTKLPNREQYGDGAPNVYYAGWLEFKVKGCNLPRQPIHFKDSIFKAPDGATGFAYTLTNGAKGKVTVYKSRDT